MIYRDLFDGELYQAGDECLHNGQWVEIGDLFAGFNYVAGTCLPARRKCEIKEDAS